MFSPPRPERLRPKPGAHPWIRCPYLCTEVASFRPEPPFQQKDNPALSPPSHQGARIPEASTKSTAPRLASEMATKADQKHGNVRSLCACHEVDRSDGVSPTLRLLVVYVPCQGRRCTDISSCGCVAAWKIPRKKRPRTKRRQCSVLFSLSTLIIKTRYVCYAASA